MKKILLVTDAWTPQVNGVVRVLEKTTELLKKENFEVKIIHPAMFRTLPMPFYREIRLALFARKKVKDIIHSEKPDHIHIATEGPLGLASRAICIKEKIKFSTSYHTHFARYVRIYSFPPIGLLLEKITYSYIRWFHNASEKVMVGSESLKNDIQTHGVKRIVLWPLGVDVENFERKNFESPIKLNKPVFSYFGRLAKEKNVEEFFNCTLPGTKLVIGDGPQKNLWQKKYPNVVFVGYKTGKDLVNWLSVCDVLIFPSKTDTFGLVIIEAMACGIPVAAHDVTGPKDIITNGIDGFLDENLSKAAVSCLSLKPEKCREKALKFSWNNSIKAFIENLVEAQ